jgi:putative YhdH/YhfP family quinone oxidoreductase
MASSFRCYLVEKGADGQIAARVAERSLDDLPAGEVLIRVAYSSLNYKDALASQGHPGVVRSFPHVPGIDAAGTVEGGKSANFLHGQQVLVTGYELGAPAWGGFAEYIRVPERWVVPLPSGLTMRESMIYGTAGFTAALSLDALQRHGVTPGQGEVVVTGASGGVGSIAVALLAKAGFQVAAVSGKPSSEAFLRSLGAASVLPRSDVHDTSTKPLLGARWAGAVDTVGGNTLATVLRSMRRAGCAAACGLVGGTDLNLTVYPFILRGAALVGIDSAECSMEKRLELWQHLASDWKPAMLDSIVTETVALDGLGKQVERILKGETMGRVLVKLEGAEE